MTRSHGKDTQLLLGSRNATGDTVSFEPSITAETHDTTTMGDDWTEATAGLIGWEASAEFFYDNEASGITSQLQSVGSTFAAATLADGDGDTIGDTAVVCGPCILTNTSTPFNVADMTKHSATFKGHGKLGAYGKVLHPLGQETVTASTTSVNNGASSANGGIANIHVTAVTGTWDVVVQESSDNGTDPWATKATFTQITAATAESVTVAGTVEQYIRITATETVAGSITFAAAFARY